jgi:Phage virion morphogenesis family
VTSFTDGIASISQTSGQGNLTVHFNAEIMSDITGRLRPYKNFPITAKPALSKVADYVRMEMIPRTFHQEGPGWRKLSRRTKKERAAQGYGASHPILIRSKDLFKELTDKSHPNHVEVIKTGKYARITIGGSSEKFIRNQTGDKSLHIPSRPMIPGTMNTSLPDRDRQAINKILVTTITEDLQKHV